MANYETLLVDKFTGEKAIIKSNDYETFEERKRKKLESWKKRHERELMLNEKEKVKQNAEYLNQVALSNQEYIKNILKHTLTINDRVNWESLKDKTEFTKFKFKEHPPKLETFLSDLPKKSWLELIFKSKLKYRLECEQKANDSFKKATEEYDNRKSKAQSEYETEKAKFINDQMKHNNTIDDLRERFESGEDLAIEEYLKIVFKKSNYPDFMNISYEPIYVADRRTVLINIDLPSPDSIPKEIEYKYVSTKNEISIKYIKDKEFKLLYNDMIAQIAVRTIHEIFESVYMNFIDFVVLNGYVTAVDKKTGQDVYNCILSVQANKDYFNTLNLDKVSPMDCISGMKGIVASEFINLAPVRPILNLNREDKRIIESDEIIDSYDMSNNLADMEWQKFEVLVRDLFAKEFSGEGVDVKVTQASRDAGVDALIFDPDPIKGGKFVIQAKRYNNVVGVSAVRDLYGTVMNEGAVKGILVTTSTFGKDSIEFAKDKPLTLISGAELVHLFNKHGYDVTIQIKNNTKKNNGIE